MEMKLGKLLVQFIDFNLFFWKFFDFPHDRGRIKSKVAFNLG